MMNALANHLMNIHLAFLRELMPNAKVSISGKEMELKTPEHKISFNMESGKWFDFKSGRGGFDLISLYAFLKGMTNNNAFKELSNRIGNERGALGMDLKANSSRQEGRRDTHIHPPETDENVMKPEPKEKWENAKALIEGDAVSRYLKGRGINTKTDSIRFSEAEWNSETKTLMPCMISNVCLWPRTETTAVHRTYLKINEDSVEKAKVETPKMILGRMGGGAVRLSPLNSSQPLIVAEGIETALSVLQAFPEASVWTVLSASNFVRLTLPRKEMFSGIIIAADNDKAGTEAADRAGLLWTDDGFQVKIATPKREGQDFNDVLMEDGLDEVRALILTAKNYQESPEEAVERLKKLSPFEYDKTRKEEARKLNVSLSTLDKEVKKKNKENNCNQLLEETEMFDHMIDGIELVKETTNLIKRVSILPEKTTDIIALWIIFTWFIDYVDTAPILAICSPEKQCGKTTLLSMIINLVKKPLAASNITPACTFRAIEKWKPTLIIDEADTFIKDNEELRGVINSGHTRATAFVIRATGDDYEPTQFSTWGAKAIALIGKLPETLHDRSIVINLSKKTADEKTEKIKNINKETFKVLRSKFNRFSHDNKQKIIEDKNEEIKELSDRSQDNWDSIFSIAKLCGENFYLEIKKKAIDISSKEKEERSESNEILQDVREIFDNGSLGNKILLADLVDALCEDDEKPWKTYNRGFPIKIRQLSEALKAYRIQAKTIRIGQNIGKGITREQCEDAFKRYTTAEEDVPKF